MAVRTLTWGVLGGVMIGAVQAQDAVTCYGAGSMAMAVIFTFLATLGLVGGVLYFLKRRADANRDNHLILETDPERGGKAEYAFDNPGFKDATLIVTKPDSTTKSSIWAPIFSLKTEKKRPQDDSVLQSNEVKVVALKSQDFTGLGFNVCGNMRDGIFIRDILHRGPAFESGKLNAGDRIQSVTISFEHMVYEDAVNILSYASPYEVMIEAKGGRLGAVAPGQGHPPLVHPVYRSSSALDLTGYIYSDKSSKKKPFGDDHSSSSNYSSLQKSRSNVTTLERKESKSPRPKQTKRSTPEMHLRAHLQLPIEEAGQKSPKMAEQNQNNANIEIQGIDEVDLRKKPEVKKREKKPPELNRAGSDIRRDVNGIPLEIPEHMLETANYAKRNRKSELDRSLGASKAFEDLTVLGNDSYTSDSEDVSVNTIELNSSDVVVHQMEDEKSRKTASTGDLTKMKKTTRSNAGTLERAQSLDITDTSIPSFRCDARENLLIDREPRLSLILDGLNTFQKDRLKSSREWGNLEDAILSPDEEERRKSEPQFNAVMDRVIQIKRESLEIELPEEISKEFTPKTIPQSVVVNNKLWPDEEELKPPIPERTKLKVIELTKPTPPKREKEATVINLNEKTPVTTFEKHHITEMCSQLAKSRNGDCKMIKDEWEVDNLNNTSPPGSLMEEVLDSYYNNVTVVQTNLPDETKRVQNATEDFIINERNAASEGSINIPDDIKAAQKTDSLHSLEFSVNTPEQDSDVLILSTPLYKDSESPESYVTEIHVSEVTVNQADLDNAFENYIKNFEDPPEPSLLEKDVEKQVTKIQELAEEQLKTLPEMRFTTSSYETSASKQPEKRHSFELLRSSFEKVSNSPPRRGSITPPKSRIPIATSMKTPPTSPERRDSRNLENDTALLELASKIKPPGKSVNVSVTSIRNNSKIPSGLPTLASRPPIPPRKSEDVNGGVESSFKQWVFSPSNNVTNVTVGKEK